MTDDHYTTKPIACVVHVFAALMCIDGGGLMTCVVVLFEIEPLFFAPAHGDVSQPSA